VKQENGRFAVVGGVVCVSSAAAAVVHAGDYGAQHGWDAAN